MNLLSYSITHHNCPVQFRERVALTPHQQLLVLKEMNTAQAISEAAVLQTCNRLEFFLYAGKNFDVGTFLAALIKQLRPDGVDTWQKYCCQRFGIDVVHHLFEVAAGLDSQMIGENQILSQVKSAYTQSLDCRMSKFVFHRLFHSAFRVGKAIRTETDINCGAVSVGLAAVESAKRKFDLSASTAMVIGAGENAELVARYLLKAKLPHLIIANRNAAKAKDLQDRLKKGRVIVPADIAGELAKVDLLISSTSAAEPVVTYEAVKEILADREKPLLIIDIAVPRDIDPKISQFDCVTLVNIDDLNEQIISNRQKRHSEVPKASRIVDEYTAKFAKWFDSLNLLPVISKLTQKGIDLAHSEAARYAKDFSADSYDKLELFAESLVKKLLHRPISFLKGTGAEEPGAEQLQAADLINKMFLSQGKDH